MGLYHVKINNVTEEVEANSSSDAIIIALMQPAGDDPDQCLNSGNAGLCACAEFAGEVVSGVQSSEANIIAFSIVGQVSSPVISQGGSTVTLDMPNGSDVTALVPVFVLSSGATAQITAVDQVSGVTPNDFTAPVTYDITAEDGTIQSWTVTVTVL